MSEAHCQRCGGALDGSRWCTCGGESDEYLDTSRGQLVSIAAALARMEAKRNPPGPEAA